MYYIIYFTFHRRGSDATRRDATVRRGIIISCEMNLRATCGKGGAAAVVLSHSARLNAKEFARVTDEITHPDKLGRPASNYNVSRHYDAGKRNRFSCDFRRARSQRYGQTERGNSFCCAITRDEEFSSCPLSCERIILVRYIARLFCSDYRIVKLCYKGAYVKLRETACSVTLINRNVLNGR